MLQMSGPPSLRTGARDFLATIWPVVHPADSALQRRQKRSMRTAQLALVMMVVAAVSASMVTSLGQFSALRGAGLALVALSYIAWSLHGTSASVRVVLGQAAPPAPVGASLPLWRSALFFTVQLALAGWVCYLSGLGRDKLLAWLVLLPPVAHSVFLLRTKGVVVVCLLSSGIFGWTVVRWHGWEQVSSSLLAFSFALVFTLIFTHFATDSEKSRWEVQHLAGELAGANSKLRTYAVQAEELAATRERNRLAREIHDNLGHYLTVINIQLAAAQVIADRDPARARSALEKAQSLTREGLQEIRHSVAALRASPLENKSLVEALQQMVDENRTTGQATELEVLGVPCSMSPQAILTLYRAGQEGLTNARKHAPAARVSMALDFRDPERVGLMVSDDGPGATEEAVGAGGFGLLGLRERAQLAGGSLRTRMQPGHGFTVEVEVPT